MYVYLTSTLYLQTTPLEPLQFGTLDVEQFFPHGATATSGPGPHYRGFTMHSYTPHSVGLLWTSDQSDAETSTWQHTTFTTERHPRPRRDSNPQFQHKSYR